MSNILESSKRCVFKVSCKAADQPMLKSTWVVITGIVACFNLLMLTANTAIASSDLFGFGQDNLKQIDAREGTRVTGRGHPFNFVAMDICDEDT